MLIQVSVEDLRSIAVLSSEAAEKMDSSNTVINTVVSKHDWKCPERVSIDESLESLKANSVVLNNTFHTLSEKLIEMANDFTSYINQQIREDTVYSDDIANVIANLLGEGVTTVFSGENIGGVISSLESTSMDASSIASLHGADHGINIMDFSLYTE